MILAGKRTLGAPAVAAVAFMAAAGLAAAASDTDASLPGSAAPGVKFAQSPPSGAVIPRQNLFSPAPMTGALPLAPAAAPAPEQAKPQASRSQI